MSNKFYLTTPIYYVNARPHIGHAYTTIVADVLARRHRLLGDDTFFLTGTDEHGQKIERSAAAAGIPPQQFADQVSASFETLWKRMGITNDRYIRTTDPRHQLGAQKLFADLYARGFIYLSAYTGQYSVGEEMFVEGPPGTLGPDGKPTETVTEENFFFKLSAFQRPLIDLIESGTLKVENEARKNEVLSFLRGNVAAAAQSNLATEIVALETETLLATETTPGAPSSTDGLIVGQGGVSSPELGRTARPVSSISHSDAGIPYVEGALKDLSVSRSSFTWGIPVPEPAASEAKEKHVMYVWLDALANYMTAIGYGSDNPADQAEFARYWPADLHLVGKEIIRFHCVYWPAFLLAAELPLPKAITAHGWLLFDNSKMSKSKGNIVRTETILDAFGDHVYGKQFPDSTKPDRDLFAADVLRYFLLREIPFGQDGSFSFDALITRYNADLANGYGNLVSRTLSMIDKYFGGTIPNRNSEQTLSETLRTLEAPVTYDPASIESFAQMAAEMPENFFEKYEFFGFLRMCLMVVGNADQMLSQEAPWKLDRATEEGKRAAEEALYASAESIRIITALLYPILPNATAKVWQQLGLGDIELAAKNGELTNLTWGGLKPGTKLGPLSPIFPRADKGLSQIMSDLEDPSPLTPQPLTPQQDPVPELASGNSKLATESPTQQKPEAPLKSAFTPTPAEPVTNDRLDPSAPPRTFTSPTLQVAGTSSITTHTGPTPSFTEAPASAGYDTIAAQTAITTTPADASPQITIDDFAKIELRVAQILVAERIPKADKLLRLEVDLGYEKRQILSGIAEFYTPEELIGRRIVVITNLAPRKMRGLESHGMLLAASDPTAGDHGKPALATCGEEIALGSRLK